MSTHPDDESQWIRSFHPNPESKVQLVCFPHAGGSASYYFPLSRALAADVEVLAIQYPGRQDRRLESNIDNIPELADRAFEALRKRADRSIAFFGHSMGAVVAFEVARRFEEQDGTAACRLFASGRRAPSRHRDGKVHLLADAGIVKELCALGGTDERVLNDKELLPAILRVARNDYKAIETYVWAPGPPLNCPITAMVGDSDPHTTLDEANAWAGHSTAAFDVRVFPGGHFYLESNQREAIDVISASFKDGLC